MQLVFITKHLITQLVSAFKDILEMVLSVSHSEQPLGKVNDWRSLHNLQDYTRYNLFDYHFTFNYVTNQGDCFMHSDCSWDKKCVLVPLPISHPHSGSIFAYQCVTRLQDNNNSGENKSGNRKGMYLLKCVARAFYWI